MEKELDYWFGYEDEEDDRPFGIIINKTENFHGQIYSEDAYVCVTVEEAKKLLEFLKKNLEELD